VLTRYFLGTYQDSRLYRGTIQQGALQEPAEGTTDENTENNTEEKGP